MTYKLKFLPEALKEWAKLDATIKKQLKKKLQERLIAPQIKESKLSGFHQVYKIKLRTLGYQLAYQVIEEEIVVLVIAIGKRNKNQIYKTMSRRLK